MNSNSRFQTSESKSRPTMEKFDAVVDRSGVESNSGAMSCDNVTPHAAWASNRQVSSRTLPAVRAFTQKPSPQQVRVPKSVNGTDTSLSNCRSNGSLCFDTQHGHSIELYQHQQQQQQQQQQRQLHLDANSVLEAAVSSSVLSSARPSAVNTPTSALTSPFVAYGAAVASHTCSSNHTTSASAGPRVTPNQLAYAAVLSVSKPTARLEQQRWLQSTSKQESVVDDTSSSSSFNPSLKSLTATPQSSALQGALRRSSLQVSTSNDVYSTPVSPSRHDSRLLRSVADDRPSSTEASKSCPCITSLVNIVTRCRCDQGARRRFRNTWAMVAVRFLFALVVPHLLIWYLLPRVLPGATASAQEAKVQSAQPRLHLYALTRQHPEVGLFLLELVMACVCIWGIVWEYGTRGNAAAAASSIRAGRGQQQQTEYLYTNRWILQPLLPPPSPASDPATGAEASAAISTPITPADYLTTHEYGVHSRVHPRSAAQQQQQQQQHSSQRHDHNTHWFHSLTTDRRSPSSSPAAANVLMDTADYPAASKQVDNSSIGSDSVFKPSNDGTPEAHLGIYPRSDNAASRTVVDTSPSAELAAVSPTRSFSSSADIAALGESSQKPTLMASFLSKVPSLIVERSLGSFWSSGSGGAQATLTCAASDTAHTTRSPPRRHNAEVPPADASVKPSFVLMSFSLGFLICTGLSTWRLSVDFYFAWFNFQFDTNGVFWFWLVPSSFIALVAFLYLFLAGHLYRYQLARQLRQHETGSGEAATAGNPSRGRRAYRVAAAGLQALRWMSWCGCCVPHPRPEVLPLLLPLLLRQSAHSPSRVGSMGTGVKSLAVAAAPVLTACSRTPAAVKRQDPLASLSQSTCEWVAAERRVGASAAAAAAEESRHLAEENSMGSAGGVGMVDNDSCPSYGDSHSRSEGESEPALTAVGRPRHSLQESVPAPFAKHKSTSHVAEAGFEVGDEDEDDEDEEKEDDLESSGYDAKKNLPRCGRDREAAVTDWLTADLYPCSSSQKLSACSRHFTTAAAAERRHADRARPLSFTPSAILQHLSYWQNKLHLPDFFMRVRRLCSYRCRRNGLLDGWTAMCVGGGKENSGHSSISAAAAAAATTTTAITVAALCDIASKPSVVNSGWISRRSRWLSAAYLILLLSFTNVLLALMYFTWQWRAIVSRAAREAMFAVDVEAAATTRTVVTAASMSVTPLPGQPTVSRSFPIYNAYTCTAGQQVLRSVVWAVPPLCMRGSTSSDGDTACYTVAGWDMSNQVALLLTLLNKPNFQVAYLYVNVALPIGFVCVLYHLVKELRLYAQSRRLLALLALARARVESLHKSRETTV